MMSEKIWIRKDSDASKKQGEPFQEEKLKSFIISLAYNLNTKYVSVDGLIKKVIQGLPKQLTVSELLDYTAETAGSMTTIHYDYSKLAARILEKYLQSKLPSKFSDNLKILRNYSPSKEYKNRESTKSFKHLISEDLYKFTAQNKDIIDSQIKPERDFDIDYFGFRTLERSYLLKVNGKPHETPQYLLMRVALSLHEDNLDAAIQSYHLMSQKYLLHASPTLFNAGTEFPHLSSCFLVALESDSLDGIFKTVHKCAMISKASGGIGMHISNVRASGTYISGTNGTSSGIVPMLRVFDSVSQYVDQGGNKRPGAICAYLEPWHSDVMEFLDLRKNHGKEEMRARHLFYALWIPDLFMKRVKSDDMWSLFSEDTAPGLSDVWGDKFNTLYTKYETEKRYTKQIKARKVWEKILISQAETGTPFLLYKDACNAKSNQQNLGTIKSSNLCCEVVEYSSKDEVAVCNLGSVGLPMYVETDSQGRKSFNFQKLHDVTKVLVQNLNRVIDVGSYPLEECRRSNLKHRPIAVGVQGLADVFFSMRMPFGSKESTKLNKMIFQTIYHASLEASMELAKKDGPYQSYVGSPVSKGILQYDMWNTTPIETEQLWDWSGLKHEISKYGVRNSLCVALMPTASTSQIFGYTECFEPLTSNVYTRRVLSGEHQVVNRYLIDDLISENLWNEKMKDRIIAANGSIQGIPEIPNDIKQLYKTVWEMSQRILIDMAADRAPYVDQSQSLNLFLRNCSLGKMTSMHFYAWEKGLKTGVYYLRTQAASSAIKFTISPAEERAARTQRIMETARKRSERIRKSVQNGHNGTSMKDTKVLMCNAIDPVNCESCSG